MKIVAGLQCYNEADFIKECIFSLYSFCDVIIINEGCWKNKGVFNKPKRSTDGTINIINSIPDPENKIKLFHYNGNNQIDHRQKTLNVAKQYHPDWYLNGDGDEIFHEDEIDMLMRALKSGNRSVNPTHKLFWNGLKYYEYWKPAGRFFNFKGLNLNMLSAATGCCNSILYSGSDIFKNNILPENVYIYHPSYSKNIERQKLKINHRSIDDNRKFPHYIQDNMMFRGNIDQLAWVESLHTQEHDLLPHVLRDHQSARKTDPFEKYITDKLNKI